MHTPWCHTIVPAYLSPVIESAATTLALSHLGWSDASASSLHVEDWSLLEHQMALSMYGMQTLVSENKPCGTSPQDIMALTYLKSGRLSPSGELCLSESE